MSANRAPPGVAPDDAGGSAEPAEGPVETRLPRAPAGRTGFSGAEQGARSASPTRSRRRFDPPPASVLEPRKQLELRHAAPDHRPSPTRSVESAQPGWLPFRGPLRLGERLRHEMRRTFRRTNPLFKERAPELHVAFRASRSFHPETRRVSRFMALHSLRITEVRGVSRRFAPTPRANRLSFDAPFESLPAGPHERFRHSTIRSAFHH